MKTLIDYIFEQEFKGGDKKYYIVSAGDSFMLQIDSVEDFEYAVSHNKLFSKIGKRKYKEIIDSLSQNDGSSDDNKWFFLPDKTTVDIYNNCRHGEVDEDNFITLDDFNMQYFKKQGWMAHGISKW